MNKNRCAAQYDVLSMDVLASLTDDELAERYKQLLSERENNRFLLYSDLKLLEIEDCYYRREIQLRRKRKEAHDAWLLRERELDDEAFLEEETLPNADLDNSSYVRAHRLWSANKTRDLT